MGNSKSFHNSNSQSLVTQRIIPEHQSISGTITGFSQNLEKKSPFQENHISIWKACRQWDLFKERKAGGWMGGVWHGGSPQPRMGQGKKGQGWARSARDRLLRWPGHRGRDAGGGRGRSPRPPARAAWVGGEAWAPPPLSGRASGDHSGSCSSLPAGGRRGTGGRPLRYKGNWASAACLSSPGRPPG